MAKEQTDEKGRKVRESGKRNIKEVSAPVGASVHYFTETTSIGAAEKLQEFFDDNAKIEIINTHILRRSFDIDVIVIYRDT
jgi:hypothetical protein